MSNCNQGANLPCASNETNIVERVLNNASFARLCFNTDCGSPCIIPVDFEWKSRNNRLCFLLCVDACGENAVRLCRNERIALEFEFVWNNTLFSVVVQGRVTRTCCSCWQDDTKFIEVAADNVIVRTFPASASVK